MQYGKRYIHQRKQPHNCTKTREAFYSNPGVPQVSFGAVRSPLFFSASASGGRRASKRNDTREQCLTNAGQMLANASKR